MRISTIACYGCSFAQFYRRSLGNPCSHTVRLSCEKRNMSWPRNIVHQMKSFGSFMHWMSPHQHAALAPATRLPQLWVWYAIQISVRNELHNWGWLFSSLDVCFQRLRFSLAIDLTLKYCLGSLVTPIPRWLHDVYRSTTKIVQRPANTRQSARLRFQHHLIAWCYYNQRDVYFTCLCYCTCLVQ